MKKENKKKINNKTNKSNKNSKQHSKTYVLNVFFLVVSFFVLLLLLMENNIYNEGLIQALFFNIITFFKIIFGKTLYFFLITSIIYNCIVIYRLKKKIRIYTWKKVFFWIGFLSLSLCLTVYDIGEISTNNIFDAGQDLLAYAFEYKGAGLIGSIVAIPFYMIIKEPYLFTSSLIISLLSFFVVIAKNLRLFYLTIIKTIKYFNSEDYEKKKKILEAKKEYERNLRLEEEKKEQEEFVNYFINLKERKMEKELYQDSKGNYYTDEEFEKKKNQWNEYQERMKEFRIKESQKNLNIENIENQVKEEILENKENHILKEEVLNEEIIKEVSILKNEEYRLNFYSNDNLEKENEEIEENIQVEEDFKIEEEDLFEKENIETIPSIEEENVSLIDKIKQREELNQSIEELFKYKGVSEEQKEEMKREINDNIEKLEGVLKNFGIDAKVVDYAAGPTITRYEIKIPFSVKVKRVTELEDNLKMHLKAESIRMEAPIPGKDAIGIETPNKTKEIVYFSNIIRSQKLNNGILPIILGKDIVGNDKIIDITKLPHLLIAGTTGSGKSIAINTMISSLISKKTDEEVKFIMIDPKMVELMPYNGIPHLLTPVIIDPNMAQVALKWAVNEMEDRYKKLASLGLKNIEAYNERYAIKMPYIVIIIDELADLMMVASNSVEHSITRIAQKARAIGIHLIVATQRPSVDVVTGMIKANLPSRISFALRSSMDSRTILDQIGAEKLLGKGDMLFLDNGKAKLERIQGAYITDEEIIKLTDIIKSKKKAVYNESILIDKEEETETKDPLYDKAVEIASKQEDRLSISLIQRELRVGYNRAARICEELKNYGIIDEDNRYINLNY